METKKTQRKMLLAIAQGFVNISPTFYNDSEIPKQSFNFYLINNSPKNVSDRDSHIPLNKICQKVLGEGHPGTQ